MDHHANSIIGIARVFSLSYTFFLFLSFVPSVLLKPYWSRRNSRDKEKKYTRKFRSRSFPFLLFCSSSGREERARREN